MGLFILTLLISLTFESFGSTHFYTSNDLSVAIKDAEALSKKYSPKEILLAVDLDNTLLKTKQDLVSEPWFNWQLGLLSDEKSKERIACDIFDLLHYYHHLLSLSQMTPVQNGSAKLFKQLHSLKIPTVVLTARGSGNTSATFRELHRNQFDFSPNGMGEKGTASPFFPVHSDKPTNSGLNKDEVTRFGLEKSKPVLFQRGVFFSEGQHKGGMLRVLLHKLKWKPKAIVFIDNDQKNISRVIEAFEKQEIELIAMRLNTMDSEIKRFNELDKTEVTNDFIQLRRVMDNTYQYERPCQLPIDDKLTGGSLFSFWKGKSHKNKVG